MFSLPHSYRRNTDIVHVCVHILTYSKGLVNIKNLFCDILNMRNEVGSRILENAENILWALLGKPVDGMNWSDMIDFWSIAAKHIYIMYRIAIKERAGIG